MLNAAENINYNLAHLTELEKKFVNYAKFGRRLETNTVTGKYSSYTDAYTDVYKFFYQSDDTSDMASCECDSKTLIFFKNRANVRTFVMYDTFAHNFYLVAKSDDSYTTDELFVTNSDIKYKYLDPLKEEITEDYESHVDMSMTVLNTAWDAKATEQHNEMMTTLTAVDNELRALINSILDGADADLDQFKEVSAKIKEMLAADQSIIDLLHAVETTCLDNGDQSITHTLIDNQSVNFNHTSLTVLNLTIPTVFHGFKSYVSFTATKNTVFTILNNSGLNTIWLKNSMIIEESEFELTPAIYNMLFECNGANVYIRIEEIE